MNQKTKAALAVLAGAALWGLISLFVRGLSALGFSALQIVALRSVLGAALLGCWLLAADRGALRIRLGDWWCFAGTGILSLTLFNWCYFTAIRESQAGIAVVLLYTSPIFVMLLSAVCFGEKITRRGLAALAATFLGCCLVAGLSGGAGVSLPVFFIGLCSGLGYALYSIFGRFALRRYSAVTVTFYTLVFSIFGTVPLAQPLRTLRLLAAEPRGVLLGLGIALVCTVLPYLLYTWGLARMQTGRAAVLATIEPLVGALVGIFVFGETVTLPKLAGMALILGAVLLLQSPGQKTAEYPAEPTGCESAEFALADHASAAHAHADHALADHASAESTPADHALADHALADPAPAGSTPAARTAESTPVQEAMHDD